MTTIRRLTWRVLEVPVRGVFRIAGWEAKTARSIIVEVELSDGTRGVGEAQPSPRVTGETIESSLEALEWIARRIEGEPTRLLGRLTARARVPAAPAATSAAVSAILDAAARAAEEPLDLLLGGRRVDVLETGITIPLDKPGEVRRSARYWRRRGFKKFKLKIAGDGLDEERLKALREAVGWDAEVLVDANASLTLREALKLIPILEEYGVSVLEQPLHPRYVRELAVLHKATGGRLRIALDESILTRSDLAELAGSFDIVNIKLSRVGGPVEAAAIADAAEALGLDVMWGCYLETRLAASVAALVAATRAPAAWVDLDSPLLLAADPVRGGVKYEGPRIILPDSPGHGAELSGSTVSPPSKAEAG